MFTQNSDSKWCASCSSYVYAVRQGDAWATIHLLLTIATCGAWLPILLFHIMFLGRAYRCCNCGRRV